MTRGQPSCVSEAVSLLCIGSLLDLYNEGALLINMRSCSSVHFADIGPQVWVVPSIQSAAAFCPEGLLAPACLLLQDSVFRMSCMVHIRTHSLQAFTVVDAVFVVSKKRRTACLSQAKRFLLLAEED